MAKGKASRQLKTPEYPAATGRLTGGSAPIREGSRKGTTPLWLDYFLWLMVLLSLSATALIWLGTPFGEQQTRLVPLVEESTRRLGLQLTGVVWAVALVGVMCRLQSRRKVRQLKAFLDHEQIVSARLQPTITEAQSGVRMRHVSAWLVAVLGVLASTVLWQTHAIERHVGGLTTLAVGAGVSVLFALAVAANAVNRLKARRLTRDFRTALQSERLALDTLGGLNAMISACLPTGERTRFNERFLQLVGRTSTQMEGRGWLEAVHVDDRQAVLDLLAEPLSGREGPREHDMCVRHADGSFVWLHETLTPRLSDKGELIEFIGTAINITKHVESEAALDKQFGDLKADLSKAQDELAEAKSELSKTKTSRNRFEKGLEEAREDVKNLQSALDKAESSLEKATIDAAKRIEELQSEARSNAKAIEEAAESRIAKLEGAAQTRLAKLEETARSAGEELELAVSENKKLTSAFEKLQGEMAELRRQDGELHEQIARHIKETREAKAEATETQTNQSQLRGRSDRLTQRCEELEAQLNAAAEAVVAAREQARRGEATAAAEVERRLHEVSAEALATQLRKQLNGLQRMTSDLLATALDGPVQETAHNTAATVRAMSELVDQALSGAGSRPAARSAAAAAFDLRRTAQGVRDLLADEAAARGVKFEVEVAGNLRGLVHGDDVEIRAALMSLASAALAIVSDGTLVMRLSEGVSTAVHSTIRCELRHDSARVKNDAFEAALAIKSTDDDMPDPLKLPVAHQAAKAWRTVRRHDGQHGYVLPEEGGFSVWFTMTLGRPAAASTAQPAPFAAAARGLAPSSSPGESATSIASASVPSSTPAAGTQASEPGVSHQMPRVPQEDLNCNLGEVVELGAESMRVYSVKPPRDHEVEISFSDEEMEVDKAVQFRAEVTWSKKLSGRKYDVGLKFLGLTPAQQKWLLRVAMQHRKVSTVLDADQPG